MAVVSIGASSVNGLVSGAISQGTGGKPGKAGNGGTNPWGGTAPSGATGVDGTVAEQCGAGPGC